MYTPSLSFDMPTGEFEGAARSPGGSPQWGHKKPGL